jgi:hypothetical protein
MIMKKVNCGKEDLIPREKWVDESEIQGNDGLVLKSAVINEAFEQILTKHRPKHKIAFVSLCTSTRPYSKSPKWKRFKELFSDDCDLIISSNGGIIPIEFEECYPYMTYDAPASPEFKELYINTLYNRLNRFFTTHHYDYIIFNYRPATRSARNRGAAQRFIENFNGSTCFILPSLDVYEVARQNKFKPYGHHYPDLSSEVVDEITAVIENIKNLIED